MTDKVLKDYRTRFRMKEGVFTRILELDWIVEGVLVQEHIDSPSPEEYSIAFMLWKDKK
jgi:hypothetical protein